MTTRIRPIAASLLLATIGSSTSTARDADDQLRVDLHKGPAPKEWIFLETTGSVQRGVLVLDGRAEPSRAFFRPYEWEDVALEASFLVEEEPSGVLACGFMVRARDASSFYYVHFDRSQAILVRSGVDRSWNEIRRMGGLKKPAGSWHRGRVECSGDTLRVWLNEVLLYDAKDAMLKGGRIGFYAGQGRVHVKDIVVTGKRRKAVAKLEKPPPSRKFVKVCRDAGAGAYEAFPDVCRMRDGRLISVFYAGYGHVSDPTEAWPRGGRVSYCVSEDEGATWSGARVIFDGPDDDRDPSITQLEDGRLVCSFFKRHKGSWLTYSGDAAKTWSEPVRLSGTYYLSAPLRELRDGTFIQGLYYERGGKAWGAVIKSADHGKTWGRVIDIPNGGEYLDAETDIIELSDGRLLAALRGRRRMWRSISKDRGETWSAPVSFGAPGHCPYLHRAADGTIVLAHRLPATSLRFSRDEGKSWSDAIRVDDHGGAYPSMVNLRDGSILIVFYEEGSGSDIRARRFRLLEDGVEWLELRGAGS